MNKISERLGEFVARHSHRIFLIVGAILGAGAMCWLDNSDRMDKVTNEIIDASTGRIKEDK